MSAAERNLTSSPLLDETIVKDHAGFHAESLRPTLQAFAVALAVALFDMWMGSSEHDVNRVRMPRKNPRQRVDDMLDTFVRR